MRICFVGDSLIEYFDWQARYPRHEVLNLGISGETAQELLGRIAQLPLAGSDWLVLMTGTNDILMGNDCLPAYELIVSGLRQIAPQTSLLACGILPMPLPWLLSGAVEQTNAQLEALARRLGIRYLDGVSLVPTAEARARFFDDDGVHLTPSGYAVWSASIENHLQL